MKTKKTFYRVSYPQHFFSSRDFQTLSEAKNYISKTANHKGEKSDYEYWKEVASTMYIEKITQTTETIK